MLRTVWRRLYLHDECVRRDPKSINALNIYTNSWETLKKTADVSDDELSSRHRGTALYLTLCTVFERDDEPIVDPSESLTIPTNEEIMSRWPGMSPEQVEALVRDYNSEQDRVGKMVLAIFFQVLDLAENEVDDEQGGL